MIREGRFQPAWWLPGPHLQTLWPVLFRGRPAHGLFSQRLDLPDGDFLDLVRADGAQGPLVLVMHGLEGGVQSHYAGNLLITLATRGFQPVLMHFRGCSGEPNRLTRGYHSGETGDFNWLLRHLADQGTPAAAAIGFSLGGNVLLKWLGEQGEQSQLSKAVAISVPYRLNDCALKLETGVSRLYRNHLLKKLRASYRRKFSRISSPLAVDPASLKSFRDFDHQVTAPLHGFDGVDHYYESASSRGFLAGIKTDTLLLHALDDPFMFPATVPDETELSDAVTLELCRSGGHVGFVGGSAPWRPRYWLEERILAYLEALK